eukprot:9746361-Alexandrium_andersonii.AAC.1
MRRPFEFFRSHRGSEEPAVGHRSPVLGAADARPVDPPSARRGICFTSACRRPCVPRHLGPWQGL